MSKGLRTRVKYVPSNEDQGSVIEQKYKGKNIMTGQQVPINSVIELTVGKRTVGNLVSVPNLQGLTINEAEQRFGGGSSLRLFPVYMRSEEHTSELQSRPHLVCRLLLEKKNKRDIK